MEEKSLRKLDYLILAGLLIVFLLLAYFGKHLTKFPIGIDTYVYLFRIKFVLGNFPHINWNPFWDSGTPFWLWSHPPLPYLILAALVKFFSFRPETILICSAIFSFSLLIIGIYLFALSGWGRLSAILAVLLMLSIPASFGWWSDGNYSRMFGLGFWSISFGLTAMYLKSREKKRSLFLGIVLASVFAHSSHLLLGALTILANSLLIIFWSEEKKLTNFLKLVLLPVLVSSYWYVPLFFMGNPSSRFWGGPEINPMPLRNLFYPKTIVEHYSLLPPFTITFVVGLLFFLFRRKKEAKYSEVIPLAILATIFLVYLVVGNLPFYPKNAYINGFPPIYVMVLFSILLSILTSALWMGVNINLSIKKFGYLLLIITSLVGIFMNKSFLAVAGTDVTRPDAGQTLYQKILKIDPGDQNFRFGTDSAYVADWFNYKFDIPQTRDYFSQGQIYPNWQAYLENAVWFWENNYKETNALLDWYGVKDFFVGQPHFQVRKFLDKPDFYLEVTRQYPNKELKEGQKIKEIFEFEYKQASPVFSSCNTPTILVVGNEKEYNSLFRSFVIAGIDSQKLIPIKGGTKISPYLKELQNFSAIFLYRPDNLSLDEEELIRQYLEQGGSVFLETKKGLKPSDFFPIKKQTESSFSGNWLPKWLGDSLLKVSEFAPLQFGDEPWIFFEAKGTDLKDWAHPILTFKGKVLIAGGNYGKGRIVWSGLNLPFHIVSSRSSEEAKALEFLLVSFLGLSEGDSLSTGLFLGTEERRIDIPKEATGVLLKESYFKNWKAFAEIDGKRDSLKIFQAGPGFMYVNFPLGTSMVEFEYKISIIEKFARLISLVSLLIFFAWLSNDNVRNYFAQLSQIGRKKTREWWEDEVL